MLAGLLRIFVFIFPVFLFPVSLIILNPSFLFAQVLADLDPASGEAVIRGDFVIVGMQPNGAFGGGDALNPPAGFPTGLRAPMNNFGFHVDGLMDGFATFNGEFFTPGDPEEGWGVEINGTNFSNNRAGFITEIPGSITGVSTSAISASILYQGSVAGLQINTSHTVSKTGQFIQMDVTLLNTTAGPLNNVFYYRNVDPDNDQTVHGDFETLNTVRSQGDSSPTNLSFVTAEQDGAGAGASDGTAASSTLSYFSIDPRARVSKGGFSVRTASDIHAGTGDGIDDPIGGPIGVSDVNDVAISIALDIGTLAAGESTSFTYFYNLSPAATLPDLDSDNDGIPNVVEGFGDTDGDGIPDFQDLDSDNDGIPDSIESGSGGFDLDGDGVIDAVEDLDADGIPDICDSDQTGGNDLLPTDGIDDTCQGGTDTDGDGIQDSSDPDVDNDGIADNVGVVTPPDSDGDGVPDFQEIDSDGDGVPDTVESGIPGDLNQDGIIDTVEDQDADGIPDSCDVNQTAGSDLAPVDGIDDTCQGGLDTDGDGIQDSNDPDANGDGFADAADPSISGTPPTFPDTDSDGVPDFQDLDSDNDGIPDNLECSATPCPDTDGDGVPDLLDTDSDNDGIPDTVEGGDPLSDTNNDGVVDALEDQDGDGIIDLCDVSQSGGADLAPIDGIDDTCQGGADTDGDGIQDSSDPDLDGDGLVDIFDTSQGGTPPVLNDEDGDNIPDFQDLDSDNDGILDSLECSVLPCPDTDGNGTPDYQDLDSDGDGIPDITEAGGDALDPDGDGVIDVFVDTDGDGLADVVDDDNNSVPGAGDGSGNPLNAPDSDGDGVPDFQDLDSDNDGILDSQECGAQPCPDTDGDGVPDLLDTDSDNDGIPDTIEGGDPASDANNDGVVDVLEDQDGDGVIDLCDIDQTGGVDLSPADGIDDTCQGGVDTDGDGIQDSSDPDLDGDGLVDIFDPNQGGTPPAPNDDDGDSIPDFQDLDSDNDGILDQTECSSLPCSDTDGDGIPDFQDLDSDNDGIPDVTEAGGDALDPDGDGVIDVFVDSDGDGLADVVDDDDNSVPGAGDGPGTPLDVPDTDGDGSPDFTDLDSDGDGSNDIDETNGVDVDGDGVLDCDGTLLPSGLCSDVDPGQGGTPLDLADEDGNGVPDFQEPGFSLISPFYFIWNAFEEQLNVGTLFNKGNVPAQTTVSLIDRFGTTLSGESFIIPALGQFDVVLNVFAGFGSGDPTQGETYGAVKVEFSPPGVIDGHSSLYRFSPVSSDIEFTVIKEYANSLVGNSYAVANTFQPSLAAGENNFVVLHWLQLTNHNETAAKTFTVNRFDQGGAMIDSRALTLGPLARFDIQTGHEDIANGRANEVSLVQVIPSDPLSPYGGELYRYGGDSDPGFFPSKYSFGLSDNLLNGDALEKQAFVSLDEQAIPYIELYNLSSTADVLQVEIKDYSGASLFSQSVAVGPMSQIHLTAIGILSAANPDGVVTVSSVGGSEFFAKVSHYYYEPNGRVSATNTRHGNQPIISQGTNVYNTFIEQTNSLRLFNNGAATSNVLVEAFDLNGTAIGSTTVAVPAGQGLDTDLISDLGLALPTASYGQVRVTPSNANEVLSDLVRSRDSLLGSYIDLYKSLPVR